MPHIRPEKFADDTVHQEDTIGGVFLMMPSSGRDQTPELQSRPAGASDWFQGANDASSVRLMTFLFFTVALVGVLSHDMWRDELSAWISAQMSPDLPDLLEKTRFDGHPVLWETILYGLAQLTANPRLVQILHLLLATSSAYVFFKFSPFRKTDQLLFVFGYFSLFEYGIISRNYCLGIFLIFCFAALFESRKRTYMVLAALLALMPLTNVYCCIISIALAATLVVDRIAARSAECKARKRDIAFSAVLYCSGLVFGILQVIPAAAYSQPVASLAQSGAVDAVMTFLKVWNGYLPLPNFTTSRFWNSNLWYYFHSLYGVPVVLLVTTGVVAILATGILLLSRTPVALFFYLSGTCGVFGFMYLVHQGNYVRHSGHFFYVFIVAYWLSAYYTPRTMRIRLLARVSRTLEKSRTSLLTALLCIHFVAGTHAYIMGMLYPFSCGKQAANFLGGNFYSEIPVISNRLLAITITAFLGRPVHFLDRDEVTRWVSQTMPELVSDPKFSCGETLRKLQVLAKQRDDFLVFVSNNELTCSHDSLDVKLVGAFVGGQARDEDNYVYVVRAVKKGTR
jgi:hypothetical protein